MGVRAWKWIAGGLAAALFVLPLLYAVVLSLHAEGRGLGGSLVELARDPHPENYGAALEKMGDFPRLVFNTLLLTVSSIAGTLLTASLAGYAFARVRFRGRDALFALVLATMLLPAQATVVPRFLLYLELDLIDTWGPLLLPTVLGGTPLYVFLFRQYFLALPAELTEAARVDGCGHLRIWWSVMLPLARPMLVTIGMFTFLATWNDLWTPLIYLMSPEKGTLTLALAGFNRTYDTAVEQMMAASTVVLAPCLLVYFVAQRLFLRGVEVAASKH